MAEQSYEDVRKARSEAFYNAPFNPAHMGDASVRVAAALEYIAAQLGQINVKLGQLLKDKEDQHGG